MPTSNRRTPLPIVILISGQGSNMKTLAEQARSGELPVEIRAVISDRAAAPGLGLAKDMNLATEVVSPKAFADRASYDAALIQRVAHHQPGLVVLAGFMRILSAGFVTEFAGRLLNIHPSLLPKYPGLHTHQRALDAGDTEHGVSVHFVTEELDGGPVIIQARVAVLPTDNAASLSARVQRQEYKIYPAAVRWFAEGRLALRDASVWFDDQPLIQPVMLDARGEP